jgi:hypothetical protein
VKVSPQQAKIPGDGFDRQNSALLSDKVAGKEGVQTEIRPDVDKKGSGLQVPLQGGLNRFFAVGIESSQRLVQSERHASNRSRVAFETVSEPEKAVFQGFGDHEGRIAWQALLRN